MDVASLWVILGDAWHDYVATTTAILGRFHPDFLAGAAALVLVAVIARTVWRPGRRPRFPHPWRTLRLYWRYVRARQVNRRVILSASSQTDALVFFLNVGVDVATRALAAALMVATITSVYDYWPAVLQGELGWLVFDPGAQPPRSVPVALSVCYGVGLLLFRETGYYWVHRLSHESAVLWPFHELHHSSSTMTPISVKRHHPFSSLLLRLGRSGGMAAWVVLFHWVTGDQHLELARNGIIAAMGFHFLTAPLRHSNIPLRLPRLVEYIYCSPGLHHVHHDARLMRWNYSERFSLIDLLFGTLYMPSRTQRFRFGLPGTPDSDTLWNLYGAPFVDAGRAIGRGFRRRAEPADRPVSPRT